MRSDIGRRSRVLRPQTKRSSVQLTTRLSLDAPSELVSHQHYPGFFAGAKSHRTDAEGQSFHSRSSALRRVGEMMLWSRCRRGFE